MIMRRVDLGAIKKALIISPHFDDEILGCGGLIQRILARGGEVKIIYLSDAAGRAETRWLKKKWCVDEFDSQEINKERKQESIGAARILGLKEKDLFFLDFPEDRLLREYRSEIIAILKKTFSAEEPQLVLTCHQREGNLHHCFCFRVTKQAWKGLKIRLWQYPVHLRRRNPLLRKWGKRVYPQPYGFKRNSYLLPPKTLLSSKWFSLELTKQERQLKERAIFFFKSQLRIPILRKFMLSFIRKNEIFEED